VIVPSPPLDAVALPITVGVPPLLGAVKLIVSVVPDKVAVLILGVPGKVEEPPETDPETDELEPEPFIARM
jgi:hypothetical protein